MARGWHDEDNWITGSSNQILCPNFISLIVEVEIFEEQSTPDRADISSVLILCWPQYWAEGRGLSDCDNKKQINIRHNVSSFNVAAGGEILVSQSQSVRISIASPPRHPDSFPLTKQNDERIFVIRCDAAMVTNLYTHRYSYHHQLILFLKPLQCI